MIDTDAFEAELAVLGAERKAEDVAEVERRIAQRAADKAAEEVAAHEAIFTWVRRDARARRLEAHAAVQAEWDRERGRALANTARTFRDVLLSAPTEQQRQTLLDRWFAILLTDMHLKAQIRGALVASPPDAAFQPLPGEYADEGFTS